MSEAEPGEFAHRFDEIVDRAVRFEDDREPKPDALVTFGVGKKESYADDVILLEAAILGGLTPEGAIREFGLNRVLIMAAANPRAFLSNEGAMRNILAGMAREDAISSNQTEKRRALCLAFADKILAKSPSGPADPSRARRK